jgi:excisionase family DNA binding protein
MIAGQWFTVAEAAKLLKLSPTRVRQLLAKGRLQGCLLQRGARELWHVHTSLTRRPGKPGRPAKKARRQAVRGCGGEAAA